MLITLDSDLPVRLLFQQQTEDTAPHDPFEVSKGSTGSSNKTFTRWVGVKFIREPHVDEDEEAWQRKFAGSTEMLIKMADEAEEAYRAGRTWPIDH